MPFIKKKTQFKKSEMTNEELVWMFQAGDEDAFNEIVSRNAGAIHKQINQAINNGALSVAFGKEDAEQTALLAICQCARKYNHRYKAKFTTYAWGNISAMIKNESYENKYTVRVPRNILNEMRKYINARENLAEEDVVAQFLEQADHDAETFEMYENQYTRIASLNNEVDTERGIEGIDTIPDRRYDELQHQRDQRIIVEDAMAHADLTPQQLDIIDKMFGLSGDVMSAEELAEKYHCTRQWINTLKQKALQKLQAALIDQGIDPADCWFS